MKEDTLQKLRALVENGTDHPNFRQEVYQELEVLKKKLNRQDFMLKRTLKDKSIARNLLQQTIDELQANKAYIEEVNRQLEKKSKELSQNLEDLQASYAEVEQFAYVASHDLRSPVRTIGSFAQLIQRRLPENASKELQEFLDFIVEGANQMEVVITDLLKYSRVGSQEQAFAPVDLNKVLDIIQFNLMNELEDHDVQLVYDELPIIRAIKSSMIQLFQNLIQNAIKFRSEHSPIIQIAATQKADGMWEVSIKDNGAGLELKQKTRAFLPFQQLSDVRANGTGIGLAICKKIVQIHQGHIGYTPNEGEPGTTFYFTLKG